MKGRKIRFDKDLDNLNIQIHETYFIEAAQILWSRRGSTKLDVYSIFEKMGQSVNDMMSMLDNPESLKLIEKIEHLAELNKEFLIHLAFLVKFMMPLMEQLDASIDKHIRVVDE